MRALFCCVALLLLAALPLCAQDDAAYKPLWLYQGAWESQSAGKTDHLLNDCKTIGKFFGCQQTVNGKVTALILFIPAAAAGHYYTQAVLAEGWALGRGDLTIAGDLWIYESKQTDKDKTTYYRTTNLFTGKDKIHFELSESADGQHWKVTQAGDEVRVPTSAH